MLIRSEEFHFASLHSAERLRHLYSYGLHSCGRYSYRPYATERLRHRPVCLHELFPSASIHSEPSTPARVCLDHPLSCLATRRSSSHGEQGSAHALPPRRSTGLPCRYPHIRRLAVSRLMLRRERGLRLSAAHRSMPRLRRPDAPTRRWRGWCGRVEPLRWFGQTVKLAAHRCKVDPRDPAQLAQQPTASVGDVGGEISGMAHLGP